MAIWCYQTKLIGRSLQKLLKQSCCFVDKVVLTSVARNYLWNIHSIQEQFDIRNFDLGFEEEPQRIRVSPTKYLCEQGKIFRSRTQFCRCNPCLRFIVRVVTSNIARSYPNVQAKPVCAKLIVAAMCSDVSYSFWFLTLPPGCAEYAIDNDKIYRQSAAKCHLR